VTSRRSSSSAPTASVVSTTTSAPACALERAPRRARIGGRRDAPRRGRAPTRAPRRRRARDGRDAGRRRSESLVTDRDHLGVESGFYVRPDSFSNVCCEPPARCDWAIGVSAPSSHTHPPLRACSQRSLRAQPQSRSPQTDTVADPIFPCFLTPSARYCGLSIGRPSQWRHENANSCRDTSPPTACRPGRIDRLFRTWVAILLG